MSFGILPVSQDEYPLAPEHVRYVGDPVAAVVARTSRPRRGLRPDRRRVSASADHLYPGRSARQSRTAHSRLQRARQHPPFAGIRVRRRRRGVEERGSCVRGCLLLRRQYAPADRAACRWPRSTAKASSRFWSSTQVPHYVHRQLARVLQMPAATSGSSLVPTAASAARPTSATTRWRSPGRSLGRPVKVCLNREEVFYLHRGRHPC